MKLDERIIHYLEIGRMNILAGLYKKEDQAMNAYRALLSAGFDEKDLTMLIQKEVSPQKYPERSSAKDVAISAAIGALILGTLGVIMVLLKGFGVVQFSWFLPILEPGNVRLTLSLSITVFILSALTGTLIGAAFHLIRSRDQVKITPQGVRRGGLLLAVNIDPTQRDTAKKVLIENGAVNVENLSEMWDQEIWSQYKGVEIP